MQRNPVRHQPSTDAVRFIAPLLLAIAAYSAGMAGEMALTAILGGRVISYWLMEHDTVQLVVALIEFAAFFVASAVAVGLVTRLVLRQRRFTLPWLTEHLIHSVLLYVGFLAALYAYLRCVDQCEGLVLGAFKFYLLLALGGICVNFWLVRKAGAAAPAF